MDQSILHKAEVLAMVDMKLVTSSAAARSFSITPSAVSNMKARDTARQYAAAIQAGYNSKRQRLRMGRYDEVEQALLRWINDAVAIIADSHITLSSSMIRTKAMEIARELQIPDFKGSNGWWQNFQDRWGIKRHIYHGEAGGVDIEVLRPKLDELRAELHGVPAERLFNMDETGLFYK